MSDKKMKSSQVKLAESLLRAMRSHYPVIYIQGWEEDRLENMLLQVAKQHFDAPNRLITWSSSYGFSVEADNSNVITDPQQAIAFILQHGQPGIYLLKDLPLFWTDKPSLVRAVRDLYYQLKHKDIFVLISHPSFLLPEVLKKEIFLVKMPLPPGLLLMGVSGCGKSMAAKAVAAAWGVQFAA